VPVSEASSESAAPRSGPGRPSSGARERILEAALAVLKDDGYAGMTTAKVAARSGQNKALISYHFGSKQGLVAEVAQAVAQAITDELLAGIGEPSDVTELARGLVDGLVAIMDRDPGLARVYFDLAAWSAAEDEVRAITAEMKGRYRDVLRGLLLDVDGGPADEDGADAVAVYMIACLEGLILEQLERGETDALTRAREMFVRTAPLVVGAK
jgi:AcrR family transcriptional regulator